MGSIAKTLARVREHEAPPRLPPPAAAKRRERAEAVIRDYTMASLGSAAIPFPIVDMVGLTALQLKMLNTLTRLYGLKFSKRTGRVVISSLLSKMVARSFMPMLSSMVKVIPGIGQAAGMAGGMTTSAASTYAVGKLMVRHFEEGGNLSNLDAKAMGNAIQREFENGKRFSREIRNDPKS
jgi:uncharacterized protein (DUF697 family)